jgi:hypothetical protein
MQEIELHPLIRALERANSSAARTKPCGCVSGFLKRPNPATKHCGATLDVSRNVALSELLKSLQGHAPTTLRAHKSAKTCARKTASNRATNAKPLGVARAFFF